MDNKIKVNAKLSKIHADDSALKKKKSWKMQIMKKLDVDVVVQWVEGPPATLAHLRRTCLILSCSTRSCSWEGSEGSPQFLGPCHPHGKQRWYSLLFVGAWLSPSCHSHLRSGTVAGRSVSLPLSSPTSFPHLLLYYPASEISQLTGSGVWHSESSHG